VLVGLDVGQAGHADGVAEQIQRGLVADGRGGDRGAARLYCDPVPDQRNPFQQSRDHRPAGVSGLYRSRVQESEILRAEGEKQARILQAEGQKEAAFRDAEARERAAQAEANATKSVSDAIEGGSSQAINYFIAQKYVEALGKFATSPNAKTILFPVEATQLMGTLGGIGELAREAFGKDDRPSPVVPKVTKDQ